MPEFTREQRRELMFYMKAGDCPRFRVRCHSVLLKSEGKTSKEIRYITGLSNVLVMSWVRRYQAMGIEGLKTLSGKNRKSSKSRQDLQD